MLRALVIALLLANLAFYAWTQGWLDSVIGIRANSDREPERLARQVRPEIVRILPAAGSASTAAAGGAAAATTPAAAPGGLACLEAGPFSDSEITAAQAQAHATLPSGSWAAAKTDRPAAWIVYMGRYANRESREKKTEELKRRKLDYTDIDDGAALAPGLSLGEFDTRANAARALDAFAQRGIQTARVVELRPASTSHWLRVEKADDALAARLDSFSAALGKSFAPCANPPLN